MARAKKQDMKAVYVAAFRRYCQLVGNANDNPADPLVRDFYETLAAYEQCSPKRIIGRRWHTEHAKKSQIRVF
jgi:hypothetical protein